MRPSTRQGAADLRQLLLRRHLLGEQRCLDAVEQALEPSDELCLRDAQLRLGGHAATERQGQAVEFFPQLRRQALFELADRGFVDLAQPLTARFVQRSGPDLLQKLLDHRADPHHLGGLLDHARNLFRVIGSVVRVTAGVLAGVGGVDDLRIGVIVTWAG